MAGELMRCSKCGRDSTAGKKFCEDCGAPLANPCPTCGAETTIGKRFCGECGTPLDTAAPANAEGNPGGERRHLTVLFCDLVGSTEIAARLDPEEWREVLAAYHGAAADAITRFGGRVAKYLGDGVMAYFGWPVAHDNDAERAVRAGLELVDIISKLNQTSGAGFSLSSPVRLSARVGIDSGTVVVGSGRSREADVFGDVPNIAARVQAAAQADSVLITGATHQLVAGLFVVESQPARTLKGFDQPVDLHRVIRLSETHGRLAAAVAARSLTPFVGREEELRVLLNAWQRADEGEGRSVLVVGEAGIGKSRLLHHFHEQIADRSPAWAEAAAAPFYQNTPFYAIAELLRQIVVQTALSANGGEGAPPYSDPADRPIGVRGNHRRASARRGDSAHRAAAEPLNSGATFHLVAPAGSAEAAIARGTRPMDARGRAITATGACDRGSALGRPLNA